MIVYKAMYKFVDAEGQVHAAVLDFPGVITCGPDLNATRSLLASALADMAETYLLRGKPLPQPDPAVTDPDSDIEERVVLHAASRGDRKSTKEKTNDARRLENRDRRIARRLPRQAVHQGNENHGFGDSGLFGCRRVS